MPGTFGEIEGDSGVVLAGAGATAAIISRWKVVPLRTKPDGTTELQFKAQFSWKNDVTMGMLAKGIMRGRVQVKFRTKLGLEQIEIVGWDQWRMDGGILYLDNVTYFDSKVLKERSVAR